jgi:pyruvate/2-oxoglutarate dehydrogenase complex dihydrolipoamide acyltransferase (E2) component
MSATGAVSVEVPDIGDFEDVPIIEILVSPGDQVAVDDPLLTLESDKATMDVPAPFAGVIGELRVKVGDRVSQGTPLLTMEASSDIGDGVGSPRPRRRHPTARRSRPPRPMQSRPRSRRSPRRLSRRNHPRAMGPSTPAPAPGALPASSESSSRG